MSAKIAPAVIAARYRRDRPAIARAFGMDPGRIVGIDAGWGDRHRGGQTVARVTFDSGTRLAYKPRSVKPERFWAAVVSGVERRIGLGLRSPVACDRGNRGWVEWIPADRSPIEAPRELRRLGALVALLDLLEVRDAHPDNFVRHHGQLILVDSETVCHPRLPGFEETPSIILTGALPWPPGSRKPSILSGFAGNKAGEAAIISGFRAVYRLSGPLGPLGPLEPLEPLRTRVVLRHTRAYSSVLQGRTAALPPVPGLVDWRASRSILAAERRALARGDIPLFEVDFNGHDLRDESRIIVPGFFARSGREVIAARLRLGPEDARGAVTLLRSSLRLDGAGLQSRPSKHRRYAATGRRRR